MKNNLTEKTFWNNNWKGLTLPARFFNDYFHKLLYKIIEKHTDFTHDDFLEIGGCPSKWADYFYNKYGYAGYRHVDKSELQQHANKNNLKILFCDYARVFNFGLINTKNMNYFMKKIVTIIYITSLYVLRILNIKKETRLFSPYIFLIAKKHE